MQIKWGAFFLLFFVPQTFQGIGPMCQQHQPPQALHVPLYSVALHLVQRRHQAQSNCPADVMMSLITPKTHTEKMAKRKIRKIVEFDMMRWHLSILTSSSSMDRTQMQAALCRNPSLSYIRVEFGFSLTILFACRNLIG